MLESVADGAENAERRGRGAKVMSWRSSSRLAAALIVFSAAEAGAQNAPAPSGVAVLPTIEVFSTTPLSGTGVDVDKVPAAVTTIDSRQIEQTRSRRTWSSR